MRKKIAVLLTVILTVFVFAGCTSNQKGLYDSMKAVSKWKYTEITQTGTVNASILGQQTKADFKVTGYSDQEKMNAALNMNMTMEMANQKIELKDIQFYLLDSKYYISKSYFTQLAALSGGTDAADKIDQLDGEFISLSDLNEQLVAMYAMMGTNVASANDKIYEFTESIIKELGINVPVEKKDNTYSIDLKGEQMVDMVMASMDKGVANLDNLNTALGLQLKPEQIKEVKDGYAQEKAQIVEQVNSIKPYLKDSTLTYKYTPKESEYTQTIGLEINLKDMGMMELTTDAVAKKADKKEIKLPGKAIEMSMTDLTKLLVPETVVIDGQNNMLYTTSGEQASVQVIQKGEVTYVPFKAVMKGFSEQVVYNPTTKQVGIQKGEQVTLVKVIIEGSTSYISLEELRGLGFVVQMDAQNNMVTITR